MPGTEASATGALGSEAQTQLRLMRIETRLDAIDTRIEDGFNRILPLLEGRTKLTEKCLDIVMAFITGPNVKYLAVTVLALAAIANGVALSGYGVTLGGMKAAVTGTAAAADE
jgi:hypothetical protein